MRRAILLGLLPTALAACGGPPLSFFVTEAAITADGTVLAFGGGCSSSADVCGTRVQVRPGDRDGWEPEVAFDFDENPSPPDDVVVRSATDAWMIVRGGVYRFDGTAITPAETDRSGQLALAGNGPHLWLCDDGELFYFRDGAFALVPSGCPTQRLEYVLPTGQVAVTDAVTGDLIEVDGDDTIARRLTPGVLSAFTGPATVLGRTVLWPTTEGPDVLSPDESTPRRIADPAFSIDPDLAGSETVAVYGSDLDGARAIVAIPDAGTDRVLEYEAADDAWTEVAPDAPQRLCRDRGAFVPTADGIITLCVEPSGDTEVTDITF